MSKLVIIALALVLAAPGATLAGSKAVSTSSGTQKSANSEKTYKPTSYCPGGGNRGGRSPNWVKVKNPNAPAVKREAEEDWSIEDRVVVCLSVPKPFYSIRCQFSAPSIREGS